MGRAVLFRCVLLVGGVPAEEGAAREGDLHLCGANALAVCCRCVDENASIDELSRLAGSKGEQTSLLDLQVAARARGLETVALRWTKELPGSWLTRAPAVALLFLRNGRSHFVAVVAARGADLLVVDFPRSPSWIRASQLRTKWHWDGTMLHIVRDAALAEYLSSIGVPWKRRWRTVISIGFVAALMVVAMTARLRSSQSMKSSRSQCAVHGTAAALGVEKH